MSEKAWEDIIYRLEGISGKEVEIVKLIDTQTDDLGNEIKTNIERIDFELNGQKFRVEQATRPLILDKKSHYSHTAGQKTLVEYVVSDTETTSKINAYKWNDETDEYEPLDSGGSLF